MRLKKFIRSQTLLLGFLVLVSPVCPSQAEKRPIAPRGLHVTRQDAHAIRLSWEPVGNRMGYVLYAAANRNPLVFHRENKVPLHENFLIWDAPRTATQSFVFYLITVGPSGKESEPSERVSFTFPAH